MLYGILSVLKTNIQGRSQNLRHFYPRHANWRSSVFLLFFVCNQNNRCSLGVTSIYCALSVKISTHKTRQEKIVAAFVLRLFLRVWSKNKQTNKQTNKHPNTPTNKQTKTKTKQKQKKKNEDPNLRPMADDANTRGRIRGV